MAKESGCFVVSPHWITAVSKRARTSLCSYMYSFKFGSSLCWCLQCSERGSRVHESDYPHTYNPNMALVSGRLTRIQKIVGSNPEKGGMCEIFFLNRSAV